MWFDLISFFFLNVCFTFPFPWYPEDYDPIRGLVYAGIRRDVKYRCLLFYWRGAMGEENHDSLNLWLCYSVTPLSNSASACRFHTILNACNAKGESRVWHKKRVIDRVRKHERKQKQRWQEPIRHYPRYRGKFLHTRLMFWQRAMFATMPSSWLGTDHVSAHCKKKKGVTCIITPLCFLEMHRDVPGVS